MTDLNDEILPLLTDLESDRVERTISTNNTDKFCEAICAFSNDMPGHRQPGYLLIGVNDDGTLSGLNVSDRLLLNLANIRQNGQIQPLPFMVVGKKSYPTGDVAYVKVSPSSLPPVRYGGVTWIRVGPSKGKASAEDERLLSERRASSAMTFDAQPCQDSTIEDISLPLFEAYRQIAIDKRVIEENHRDLQQQLSSLRFWNPRTRCPTHAGILTFGINPRQFMPGAYIQFLQFPGTTMTDTPLNQAEISGDMGTVLRELDMRVKTLVTSRPVAQSGLQERDIFNYPFVAVRELLMNAVLHRDYQSNTPIKFYQFSDRIEIISPGGLYGSVTPENFGSGHDSSYRNPTIAEVLKNMGFVNRFGYGIGRAQTELSQNGNPPAEFGFENKHSVLVIIRERKLS